MGDEKTTLVTRDRAIGTAGEHEVDRKIREAADTGEGLVEIDFDEFARMAEQAARMHELFMEVASVELTLPGRAQLVRELRVDNGHSWRSIAAHCHVEWEGGWSPPSNQIMGICLCEVAARILGEDPKAPPWTERDQ